MRLILMGIVIGLLSLVPAYSQQSSSWLHATEDDPLHGKTNEKFVLTGKYVTPPEHAHDATPSIVVVCTDGKVKQSYFNVGTVVTTEGHSDIAAALEGRIDGKKMAILSNRKSTDGTALFFTRVDLHKMLRAHTVIVGVNEYLGPEVVMQFDMTDPSEVFAACGKDRLLKDR